MNMLKKLGIHAGVFLAMTLGLFLSKSLMVPLHHEFPRLLVAMLIGAYAHKPMSDWVCKLLIKDGKENS